MTQSPQADSPTLPRIQTPPRFDLWPEALRSAERLRGTLVPCGPGLRGIGWPETPRVRLAAIAPWLHGGRVAVYLTAAWVWGAARNPGHPLRLTTDLGGRRGQNSPADIRLHQLRLAPAECARFGEFEVTTPLRTALDLLYDDEPYDTRHRVAVRLLLPLIAGGIDELRREVLERKRPRRPRAIARLDGLRDPEVRQERPERAPESRRRDSQPPFMR